MKIGIDMGHTLSGADYGVVGLRPESVLTREVGTKVIYKLQKLGHVVVNCTVDKASSVSESLYTRYYRANQANVDLFISIHFNATPGGTGTEVYTYTGRQLGEATRIRQEFKSLGLRDRGTKDGSGLAVIRNTKAKAMLVECCFCDNPNDMKLYNSESFSNAIVKGITGKLPNGESGNNNQGGNKVKAVVIYNEGADRRGAEYLADYLNCPTISNSRTFDYSCVEHVYAVGGKKEQYTKYLKTLLSGANRYDTMQQILNFINGGK